LSHNPVFNRSMQTGLSAAREVPQELVDAEFNKISSRSEPMTVEGTAGKVTAIFFVLLVAAAATWFFAPLQQLWFPAMFVGLGLALWITFSKKVMPAVIVAYAAVEGVFLGGISALFESMYPGIVQSAVLGTLTTAGAMFAAYRFGWIKVDARFTRIMTFAIIGYMIFAVVNLGFVLISGEAGVYGSAFGWLAGLVGAGLAAFTLNLDFETIMVGSRDKWPVEMEWRAAFGLTVTLIWLYVEILRLLAIFNRD
jgi:Predicted membrane protein